MKKVYNNCCGIDVHKKLIVGGACCHGGTARLIIWFNFKALKSLIGVVCAFLAKPRVRFHSNTNMIIIIEMSGVGTG